MNDEPIIVKGLPYMHPSPVAEFLMERVTTKIPRFVCEAQNEIVRYLCKLFGVPPTDARYFYYGATAREPATKTLKNLYWKGNVTLFPIVEYDGQDINMSLYVEKLREPFIQRLIYKDGCDFANLVKQPFATFIGEPNLQALHKLYIGATQKQDGNKMLVTVRAETVQKALQVWLAFLDESQDANQHFIKLRASNNTVTELCRQLTPLINKFAATK
jgi:hypothetical protein